MSRRTCTEISLMTSGATRFFPVVARGGEGIVVRVTGSSSYGDFRRCVGKYVREGHVQTHGHWIRQRVVPNKLADGAKVS